MRARAAMTMAAALLPFMGALADDGPKLAPPTPTPAAETPVAQTPDTGVAPLTRADVEAWLDGFMP